MSGASGYQNIQTIRVTGSGAALFADNAGTLSGLGTNTSGELGDSTTVNKAAAATVKLRYDNVSNIAVGNSHVTVVAGSTLYAWGQNAQGQLGDGTAVSKSSPVALSVTYNLYPYSWRSVSIGQSHAAAIRKIGRAHV